MKDLILGIDWGTTNSLPAACYGGSPISLMPAGKYGIPSLFYYDRWEGVLVGEAAERAGQGYEAKYLKREVKMDLTSNFVADGRTFTSREMIGAILNHVKETALETAGNKLMDTEMEGVILAVPAAFLHNEKKLICEAAELSVQQGGPEMKVLALIKEPVAGALAYFGISQEEHTRIMVFDLGGGTCDVAVVEADSSEASRYRVIASEMLRLGGKNWDEKIMNYLIHEVEQQSGISVSSNPGYLEKIRREAINVKHAFSEKTGSGYRTRVRARVEINGRIYQIPVTEALFNELTWDLLTQTMTLAQNVMEKVGADTISKIVCVGGGSNMPQIRSGLDRTFPNKEIRVFEPEKAIAYGAALYGQFYQEELSDIAAFSYGSDAYRNYDKDSHDLIVVNLIKKGDVLPVVREHTFITIYENQRSMKFSIYESENTDRDYDLKSDMFPIMDVVLPLPENLPKGTRVHLTMTLNRDGLIEIVADDKKGHTRYAKKKLTFASSKSA